MWKNSSGLQVLVGAAVVLLLLPPPPRSLLVSARITAGGAAGAAGTETSTASGYYPLKERKTTSSQQTMMQLTMSQLQNLQLLSFSEDTDVIELDSFHLSLFETDGDLPMNPSILTIQDGINDFLKTELNSCYDKNNQIRTVQTEIMTQTQAASSRRHRQLDVTTGSQLETAVDVTFAYEPHPDKDDVEAKVKGIMEGSDMSWLLSNITSRATDDPELANVNVIYYLGNTVQNVGSGSGTNGDGGGSSAVVQDGNGSTNRDRGTRNGRAIWIPIFFAMIALLLVALLFVKKKRRRRSQPVTAAAALPIVLSPEDEDDEEEDEEAHINLFWDTQDAFSVEAALVNQSAGVSTSSPKSNRGYDVSGGDGSGGAPAEITVDEENSDIFSGIGALSNVASPTHSVTSPKQTDSKSVFSFWSGFASRGSKASTVVASNVKPDNNNSSMMATPLPGTVGAAATRSPTGNFSGTPRSRMSSLFTFSEEELDDIEQEEADADEEELEIHTAPTDEENSYTVSTPGDANNADTPETANSVTANNDTSNPYRGSIAATNTAAVTAASLVAGAMVAGAVNATKDNEEVDDDADFDDDDHMAVNTGIEASYGEAGTTLKPQRRTSMSSLSAAEIAADLMKTEADTPNKDDASSTFKRMSASPRKYTGESPTAMSYHSSAFGNMSTASPGATTAMSAQTDPGVGGSSVKDSSSSVSSSKKKWSWKRLLVSPIKPKTPDIASYQSSNLGKRESGEEENTTEVEHSDKKNRGWLLGGILAGSAAAATAAVVATPDAEAASSESSEEQIEGSGKRSDLKIETNISDENPKTAAADGSEVTEATSDKKKQGWLMAAFSPKRADSSPSAKSHNPLSTVSPSAVSTRSTRTDPGPDYIELLWENDQEADSNQANRAAGVTSVEGETATSSGTGTSSAEQRLKQLNIKKSVAEMRRRAGTAGTRDGTAVYQNDTAEHVSPASSTDSLSFQRGNGKPVSAGDRAKLEDNQELDKLHQDILDALNSPTGDEAGSPETPDRIRRHAKSTGADGTTSYQNETMGEWSVDDSRSEDASSPPVSDSSQDRRKRRTQTKLNKIVFGLKKKETETDKKPPTSPRRGDGVTPKSMATHGSSTISGMSNSTESPAAGQSDASASKQLISDLLWLEQKIAATNKAARSPGGSSLDNKKEEEETDRKITETDSLSFASSHDGLIITSDGEDSPEGRGSSSRNKSPKDEDYHHSIVCRDCYAPPGKLKIVIHSTKDGPAVHTVKKGSSLEGHIFPGDLIISVDNVDTRSYSAEQVMKMMTAKTRFERKITVLHFETDEV